MYVLCTLVLLSLHTLFKRPWAPEPLDPAPPNPVPDALPEPSNHRVGRAGRRRKAKNRWPQGHAAPQGGPDDGRGECVGVAGQNTTRTNMEQEYEPERRTRTNMEWENEPKCSKRAQQRVCRPADMFSTRKTWDLGHAPCLQDLWKKDVSLDASSVDLLMSDGEEESSFLPLQSSVFQQPRLTSDPCEPHPSESQQLLIQTLQERVCEFQARLRSEDPSKRLHLQKLPQTPAPQAPQREPAQPAPQGQRKPAQAQEGALSPATERPGPTPPPRPSGLRSPVQGAKASLQEQLHTEEAQHLTYITDLRTQIEELEEKLRDQTQEVARLRSELGATDLEKQLEVLEVENQRLKQELRASHAHQPPDTCTHCPHSQDVEALRGALALREEECAQREERLAALQQEVQERSSLVQELQRTLEEVQERSREKEEQLASRLRESEEELSRQAALPPQVKYVTQAVEVESAQCKQAVADARARNLALQEQLVLQRQLLHELEHQLSESQKTSSQLRTQLSSDRGRLCGLLSKAVGKGNAEVIRRLSKVLVYEGEMERAQGQLEVEMQHLEEEKNRVIEEAFIRAESEMKAVHENLAGVRMNLLTLQPALRTLTCDYNCLKRQVQDFPYMLEKAITDAKQEICQVIGEVSSANQELLRKYKREMNLRKKCHDELVRLKGNIRVFCRVRPICTGEADGNDAKNMVTFDPDDDAILYLSNKGKLMTFEMDKVFHPQATQEEVFQEVQSLVTSCIDGFNVCIFAYGQTGSGKTYTMEGVPEDPGINQRALRLLFSEVSEKKPDWNYNITVSMVEIYNETLRNLLGDGPSEKLDIKMCPDGSGQLYVPGLTEFSVEAVEDINKVFELGHVNRATACTNLNEHSSRSHALLIVTVAGSNSATGHRTTGKLNLVDLAGSERIAKSGAEGSRLREAQCINKSLSALGDVINALRSRQSHVPFRNSRLTYLLQDSLSGDSKTLMMVQVSPLDSNLSESVCSLKFAQRVRTVELGPPSSSSRRPAENSSTSSSPTHDSVELDSPPVTPVPLPLSRVSSAGSTLSSASRTPGSTRRRSHSQLSAGRMKMTA